jgi:hypothetical protein
LSQFSERSHHYDTTHLLQHRSPCEAGKKKQRQFWKDDMCVRFFSILFELWLIVIQVITFLSMKPSLVQKAGCLTLI